MLTKKDVKRVLPEGKRYSPVVSQKRMYIFDRHTGRSTPILGNTEWDVYAAIARGDWRPLHEWNWERKMEGYIVKMAVAKAKAKKVI